VKFNEEKLRKIRPNYYTFKQKSNPHGNVQRCPSNPQEKRRTGTGEETKTLNSKKENNGIKRKNGREETKLNGIKRKSSQGFLKGN